MLWNCATLENAQKNIRNIFKIAHFLMLRNFSAFLVLDYKKVSVRSFDYGSIDVRTKIVLPVVWQIVAFKDNLSKNCPSELV